MHSLSLWKKTELLFQLVINLQISLWERRSKRSCSTLWTLPTWISSSDPQALVVEALSLSWQNLWAYTFPPYQLLTKVMTKRWQPSVGRAMSLRKKFVKV